MDEKATKEIFNEVLGNIFETEDKLNKAYENLSEDLEMIKQSILRLETSFEKPVYKLQATFTPSANAYKEKNDQEKHQEIIEMIEKTLQQKGWNKTPDETWEYSVDTFDDAKNMHQYLSYLWHENLDGVLWEFGQGIEGNIKKVTTLTGSELDLTEDEKRQLTLR